MFVIVNKGGVLDDGSRLYKPGDKVELEGAEAERLINAGKVREAKSPLHVVVDLEEVVTAIGGLSSADNSAWTAEGLPTVEALAKALGKTITAKERDAAWLIFNDRGNDRS